jgi:hypothetical protein
MLGLRPRARHTKLVRDISQCLDDRDATVTFLERKDREVQSACLMELRPSWQILLYPCAVQPHVLSEKLFQDEDTRNYSDQGISENGRA